MGYKIKGGKLRKHHARDGGWTPLSDDAFPAAFISRPAHRTVQALALQPAFAAEIAKGVQSGEPSLCLNEDHDYEFQTMPEVFAVAITNEGAPPIVMGICPECAKQSDTKLYSMMLRGLRKRGIGKADDKAGHVNVVTEVENVATLDVVAGVRIAVALSDKADLPHDNVVVMMLSGLLRRGLLRRFMAFRNGAHNCHSIVRQLYLDFKELDVQASFDYKRGSSLLLASPKDPDGLHSWIETAGWAIDASGGAFGNPIMVQRIAEFYARTKMTNVRDINMEKEVD